MQGIGLDGLSYRLGREFVGFAPICTTEPDAFGHRGRPMMQPEIFFSFWLQQLAMHRDHARQLHGTRGNSTD